MYKQTTTDAIIRKADGAFIPADPANSDYARYLEWVAEGNVADPIDPPTEAEIMAKFTGAIQTRLDQFAQTRGYDNILSAATYATSTVVKFATEGQAAVDARDSTWDACYTILGDVKAGTRPMPTLEALLLELPALSWPA